MSDLSGASPLPADEQELIPTGQDVRVSAEHNLDCSLNRCGLGLYAGAELIFGGGFKGDRVGTMIEGEISGFGHHRELFVPDTTFD